MESSASRFTPLDSLDARPLTGTEPAVPLPFSWSTGSRVIAFYADWKLKEISVSGGPAERSATYYPGCLLVVRGTAMA